MSLGVVKHFSSFSFYNQDISWFPAFWTDWAVDKNTCPTSDNCVLFIDFQGCGVYDLVLVICIKHSVYLQCSENLQPVARRACSYLEFKTGTQCRSFMAGNLGSMILVRDRRILISDMWRMENRPGMILPLDKLISYHFFYLFPSGNNFQTKKPPQLSIFRAVAQKQEHAAVKQSLLLMSLTREAFHRPTRSKPARTSPHLVSDCAGVWQLQGRGGAGWSRFD